MNFRFSLLLGLLVTAASAHAQTGIADGGAAQANLAALTAGSPAMLPRGESYGMKGSPYADARWLPAKLTLSNNLPLAPIPLKYDVLEHRLLMRPLTRGNDSLLLDDRQVVSFVLMEPLSDLGPARSRLFRRFLEAPNERQRQDYVEVLHEGQHTLLKHYIKSMKKADYQGAYSNDQRYDVIDDKTVYYLRSPAGVLQPIKLGLKPLQAAAPALADALKTAVATQRPKTDADWAAVLRMVDPAPAK
ncbi:hypothetical protein [Hymenobacter glacialis]|uniref:Uncharacterized protein n=1 Tax=Hymenobacter glacialis TaxID=1908236 RepID=A0A1G1TCD4_9BACT|nr:hypothetical protein [Hymenobacter glacialis]OGX88535.1 hypothetical protein BEN48_09110 [Hymenobacter glacialis]